MEIEELEIKRYVNAESQFFKSQSFILKQSEPFKGLYFIRNGFIKILKKDPKGKDLFVCFITNCDLIGVTTFFDNPKYEFSAQAISDCDLIFISPEEFNIMLKKSNELNKKIMEILIHRINFFENWMINVLNLSVHKRLAESLIYYSVSEEKFNDDVRKNDNMLIHYSIDELAGITGSTNAYINKILQQFSKRNIIKRINSHELKISDYMGLLSVANAPTSNY